MWASAVTVAGPEAEPVSLEAAKEFLRIDADDDSFDAELTMTIAGVRDDVERITSTRLITQTVQLAADEFADLLQLPIGPVQEVVSIAYDDLAGAEHVLAPARYELVGAGLVRGVRCTVGNDWPNDLRRATGTIRVTLKVGHGDGAEDLPQSLYVAMLRAVKAEFEGTPIALAAMLDNHRIWL